MGKERLPGAVIREGEGTGVRRSNPRFLGLERGAAWASQGCSVSLYASWRQDGHREGHDATFSIARTLCRRTR